MVEVTTRVKRLKGQPMDGACAVSHADVSATYYLGWSEESRAPGFSHQRPSVCISKYYQHLLVSFRRVVKRSG